MLATAAAALILGASVTAANATAALAAEEGPSVALSGATDIPQEGANITVTGSGFAAADRSGSKPGVYIGVGPKSALEDPAWFTNASYFTAVAWQGVIAESGDFTTTLAGVKPVFTSNGSQVDCRQVECGVFTFAAHGSTDRSQDTYTPITFAAAQPEPVPSPDPQPSTDPEPTPDPEPKPEPTWQPAISVFLADGTTPYTGQPVKTNDELVVKGSGFDPKANVGGRGVPIPKTLPQGSYVVFGSFLENWKPSVGAPSDSRKPVADQRWVLTQSVLDQVPSQYQSVVRAQWTELATSGTFETTLVAKDFEKAAPNGTWGVYTYAAGGVNNAAQELSVTINYVGDNAPHEPETPQDPDTTKPSVTVTPRAINPGVANTLTVTGTGFTGEAAGQGAYVLFGKKSLWNGNGALPGDGWLVQEWVQPREITNGSFTKAFTIDAGATEAGVEYQVVTSAAHALSVTNRSLDTFTPITVTNENVGPRASIDGNSTNVKPGASITVRASGFVPGEKVAAEVRSEPIALGSKNAGPAGDVAFTFVIPANFEAGNHTIVLTAASGSVVVPFSVAAAAPATPAQPGVPSQPAANEPAQQVCVARAISGATLDWGIKASFRNYIQGGIANGTITTNGVSKGDTFGWSGGTGSYNTEASRGIVRVPGSVHFEGHEGVLSLTVSNVRVQLSNASSGTLYADIQSSDMSGAQSSNNGVALANLSFSSTVSGGALAINGASASLTSAGAAAFAGFYEPGAALDSLSLRAPLGAEVECDSSTASSLASTGSSNGDGMLSAAAFAALFVLFGAGVLGARRVRARRMPSLAHSAQVTEGRM